MPRGPKDEWRPADPIANAVHVVKMGGGPIEETYEPPADRRRPPEAGDRARAAGMTPEERFADARRASDAGWKGASA